MRGAACLPRAAGPGPGPWRALLLGTALLAMQVPVHATADAQRGRAIVRDRVQGFCLLCHEAPIPEERFQGNLGPSLAGVGARLDAAQLRARLVDSRRLNPQSIMPAYGRTEGLAQVGVAWAGKPILTEAQIDDVVAYLASLKE